MKLKSYLLATAAFGLLATTACTDWDAPAIVDPVATLTPNTTIEQLKTEYWDPATNYIDTVELTNGDEHVVIAGRVISSDATGNIYKSLVIQDATGALAMSINANSLYNEYRVGQEIVVDVTDMYIGKYNGLQQLGFPEWYEKGQAWEATFMPKEFFDMHVQLNGMPDRTQIDTLTISYSDISSQTDATLIKYQSQLVRFDNAEFEDGGKLAFTDGSKITSNRTLITSDGNSITVRTSGYSNFWSVIMPKGKGSVVGILSYYGTSGWQLLLRSINDLIGFENFETGDGSEENPYSVASVIGFESAGENVSGWVTGYIVGAVKPGTSAITSVDDISWTDDVEMNNTLVIGNTPDSESLTEALVIELPANSALRKYGNLLENPTNYKKQIWVNGTFAKVLGTFGITNNDGSKANFRIEGVTVPDEGGSNKPDQPSQPSVETEGQGTDSAPYTVADVIKLKNPGTSAWVEGYIVGYVAGNSMSQAVFGVPADRASNIILAPNADCATASLCIPVQLSVGTDARKALNLMDNPTLIYGKVKVKATLSSFCSTTGLTAVSSYVIE